MKKRQYIEALRNAVEDYFWIRPVIHRDKDGDLIFIIRSPNGRELGRFTFCWMDTVSYPGLCVPHGCFDQQDRDLEYDTKMDQSINRRLRRVWKQYHEIKS